jgi:predicted esterase
MNRFRLPIVLAFVASFAPPAEDLVTYRLTPQETDPAIHRFNNPHYVVFDRSGPSSADLLVFMTGTGANPGSVADLLAVAAAHGYRAVSLSYNDVPAIIAVCPQDRDPACSAKVRQKRIFGDDVTERIDDTAAESIVNRLVKLLARLDQEHPSEQWSQYLENGALKWERIAVSGHSQGAGMAAYIAQKKRVARVIVFSGPWDFHGRDRQLDPWVLAGAGATPAALWFGAYHKKENTAALIAQAYKGLGIPPAHIRVLALEPARIVGENPYHLSVVGTGTTPRDGSGLPLYAEDWSFLLGSPTSSR